MVSGIPQIDHDARDRSMEQCRSCVSAPRCSLSRTVDRSPNDGAPSCRGRPVIAGCEGHLGGEDRRPHLTGQPLQASRGARTGSGTGSDTSAARGNTRGSVRGAAGERTRAAKPLSTAGYFAPTVRPEPARWSYPPISLGRALWGGSGFWFSDTSRANRAATPRSYQHSGRRAEGDTPLLELGRSHGATVTEFLESNVGDAIARNPGPQARSVVPPWASSPQPRGLTHHHWLRGSTASSWCGSPRMGGSRSRPGRGPW